MGRHRRVIDYQKNNAHTVLMKKALIILIITLTFCTCGTMARTEKEVFTVSLNSRQIPMGMIDIQFDQTFPLPGMRKISVTMNYFPAEDAVCLQYRADLMTYYQFWSRSGRAAFVKALEEYKEDYAARNLDRRGGRPARRKYGNAEGYLIWQLSRFTTQFKGEVNIEIGYTFKDNSPYFMLNQREAHYADPVTEKDSRESQQIAMYFTRARADDLAVFFSQEYLQGLASGAAAGSDDYYDDYYEENEIQSGKDNQADEY